jgi:hypothetical protein
MVTAAAAVTIPAGPATAATAAERHGLRGDYYVSAAGTYGQFTTLAATVVDPAIDFGDLDPILESLTGQGDHDTVRWTGQIEPRFTETCTFTMIGDNGFRLWVDNQVVIDHWVDDWDRMQTGTPIALQAGRRVDIKVEYFENVGGSNLHLNWSSPSQPVQPVPNAALYLPPDFAYPGPLTSTIPSDGGSVAMTFEQQLRAVPSDAASHFRMVVGGTEWPVTAATSTRRDRATVQLRLGDRIPAKAGSGVRAVYDGAGGLTAADGTAVPAFNVYVANESTYQITTPWAKDVSARNALPEYPRPQLTRDEWRNLNGTWQYQAAGAEQAPPTGALAEKILVPYPPESLLSGVQRHDDAMWYRRTFTVPSDWRIDAGRAADARHTAGQRLLLHFGAVDYAATVWVNGTQVGTHTGGYTGFDIDVTDALTGHGPQTLLLKVTDQTEKGVANTPIGKQRTNPSGIWYTPSSGIWQTVWMEPVAAAHIDRLDTTPDLAAGTIKLTVHATGVTGERVEATAWDGDRKVGSVTGAAGAELALPVPNAKLWSPDHPFLYDLKVKLVSGGRTVDRADSYFGMRSVSVGNVNGQPHMLLNGEFVFNIGTLDQGFWPDGLYTAPTDAALRYDLKMQKDLGFNMVRKHIKVEPDRWYYWADKLGLIVWQDMPSMDPGRPVTAADKVEFESQLHTMIDQHRSHPSITTWVPFNEGWAEYEPSRVTAAVKAWDPSRLVNTDSGQNCCASLPDEHAGDIYDDHTYPGPGHPSFSDGRAIVDGEFGGLGLKIAGHMWFGGGFAYEMETSKEQLTSRYVQLDEDLVSCVPCGLSASVYTQPVDVEGEINGLATYDRRVMKVDPARVRAANLAVRAAAGDLSDPAPPSGGTPGLTGVGFWPLDQVTGATTPDASGAGHDGTLVNGPTAVAGANAGALHLAGNQWVDTGASLVDTAGNYSVSAWVSVATPAGRSRPPSARTAAPAADSSCSTREPTAGSRSAWSAPGRWPPPPRPPAGGTTWSGCATPSTGR